MPAAEPAELDGEIEVELLAALRQQSQPPLVLDVREPWEVALCSLPGSLNLPLGELARRVDEIPRGVPLVVMCHHGMRSARAAAWLRDQGWAGVANLSGGIDAWARRIEPGMAVY